MGSLSDNISSWFFQKSASGRYIEVYKGPRALYTNLTQSFIYFETVSKLRRGNKMELDNSIENMIRLGFEESDIIMCDLCADAVAVHEARNYEVCTDCFHEFGV